MPMAQEAKDFEKLAKTITTAIGGL